MNLTYLSLHCIIDCNNTHMMYWHFVFCKVNQSYHLLWDKQKVKSLEFVKKGKKNTLRNWNVNAANYFLVFWLKLDQTTRDLTFIILSVTHQSVYKKMTSSIYCFVLFSFLINSIKAQNCEDIILEGCHSCGSCDTLYELEAENAAECQEKCTFLRLSQKYCKYFEFFDNKVPIQLPH